jgi:hypothetical protein
MELAPEELRRVKEERARALRADEQLREAEEALARKHDNALAVYQALRRPTLNSLAERVQAGDQSYQPALERVLRHEQEVAGSLHEACMAGDAVWAKMLVARGLDSYDGAAATAVPAGMDSLAAFPVFTPLACAVVGGSVAVLEVVLACEETDPEGVVEQGLQQTALHLAVHAGGLGLGVFTALAQWSPQLLAKPDTLGRTPLHLLAYRALRRERGRDGVKTARAVLEEVLTGGLLGENDEILHQPDAEGNTVLALDVLYLAVTGAEQGMLKARMAKLHDKAGTDGQEARSEALVTAALLTQRGLDQALGFLLDAKPGLDLNARWCPYSHTAADKQQCGRMFPPRPKRRAQKGKTSKRRTRKGTTSKREGQEGTTWKSEFCTACKTPTAPLTASLLQLAAQTGNTSTLQALLDRGAKPDPQDARFLFNYLRGEFSARGHYRKALK